MDARSHLHLSRRRWLGLVAATAAPAVGAQPRPTLRVGINAGVSFAESEDQQRARYKPLLDALGRTLGLRLEFAAVYSDRVARALADDSLDLLLVHTHAALKAQRDTGHAVVALSEDRKDDSAIFFVHPESRLTHLRQLASVPIGVPGLQSWATATARATLRSVAPGREPAFKPTRLQEVVPYMVALRSVPAGACRSRAVVDEAVAKGQVRVLHVTEPLPLYALVASPRVPATVVEALGTALDVASDAGLPFEGTPLRGLRQRPEQAARLAGFFLV